MSTYYDHCCMLLWASGQWLHNADCKTWPAIDHLPSPENMSNMIRLSLVNTTPEILRIYNTDAESLAKAKTHLALLDDLATAILKNGKFCPSFLLEAPCQRCGMPGTSTNFGELCMEHMPEIGVTHGLG
jgi:hypothetical protein